MVGGRPETRLSAKSFDNWEGCCTGRQSCKNLNDREVTFGKYICIKDTVGNNQILLKLDFGDFLTPPPLSVYC